MLVALMVPKERLVLRNYSIDRWTEKRGRRKEGQHSWGVDDS